MTKILQNSKLEGLSDLKDSLPQGPWSVLANAIVANASSTGLMPNAESQFEFGGVEL